jgi:hypothetical protein
LADAGELRRHAMYAPLRELWASYAARATLGLPVGEGAWAAALVQSDLHGAELRVAQSKDAGRLGKQGTVVMDTPNAFHLVSPDDRLFGVPRLPPRSSKCRHSDATELCSC